MLQAFQRTPHQNLPIQPLPILAVADPDSNFDIFETDPGSSIHPDVSPAEKPFSVIVHAYGHPENALIKGMLRWRSTNSNSWNKEPLSKVEEQKWAGTWTPPNPGNYEWQVELWNENESYETHKLNKAENIRTLRAERSDLIQANWHQLSKLSLSEINTFPEANSSDVFLLPPIFPVGNDNLIGNNGLGHYSIDKEIGDAITFGKFAANISSRGITLAMTLPIHCSSTHPFRIKEPSQFSAKGIPDLISEGWQERRAKWESIFRYWIVQGIEIFELLEITQFPLSFWDDLIQSLRKDFPHISFITKEKLTEEERQKMLSVGFSDCNEFLNPKKKNLLLDPQKEEPDKSSFPMENTSTKCLSSDPKLKVSLDKIANKKFLLIINNTDPSIKRSAKIHIENSGNNNLKEQKLYYLRDLDNGRAYRWHGSNNHITLKAGELGKKFLIELN
ncbi:MAG: hypothetical protein OSB44_06825 [Verrucomicrobiales bacterium]|nr:hypothetical protein [Verrucomicrobiales bacterium]